ncbi:hypothetical protein TRFO_24175 [Tritrichomonas foetus]|uniref:non-specific serine/threonine protein kinase n=1 Tax=Tritrichomonas foetus TaxID=1144522 RepID=A0A1J4KDA3_9EUKA|nr:hypothetical protein TRFO_24175 [Tritrichomonas foetus]|eukprot:OHT07606.1 hypothetical protein TRFO_24175 [Tritrichomonas foetus]
MMQKKDYLYMLDRYQVLKQVGKGAFGNVYKCYDPYRNEIVAIKKISWVSSPLRIHKELEAMLMIKGMNNVALLQHAQRSDDSVFLIMNYCHHQKISRFLFQIDGNNIRNYMRGLLEALANVHSKGLIHRDVKPGNFLYDFEKENGCLVDFGLCEKQKKEDQAKIEYDFDNLERDINWPFDDSFDGFLDNDSDNNSDKCTNESSEKGCQNNIFSEVKIHELSRNVTNSFFENKNRTFVNHENINNFIFPTKNEPARKKVDYLDPNKTFINVFETKEQDYIPESHYLNSNVGIFPNLKIVRNRNNESIAQRISQNSNQISPNVEYHLYNEKSDQKANEPENHSQIRNFTSQNDRNTDNLDQIFDITVEENLDDRPCMRAARAGTRGYRAPEVLWKSTHQTTKIDIWSAGMIFLSLLSRRLPFLSGSGDLAELNEIGDFIGHEKMQIAALVCGRFISFPGQSFQPPSLKSLVERLNPSIKVMNVSDDAFDLLEKMLDPNPFTRSSSKKCLRHPYFRK